MWVEDAIAVELERRRRKRPYLSFAAADLSEILSAVQESLFPSITQCPEWYFIESRHLACIVYGSEGSGPRIYMHAILNRVEVPLAVFRHIFVHELLHLTIPARDVGGKLSDHPPEFFETEKKLSPDGDKVWAWLWGNFAELLRADSERECIHVRPRWREKMPRSFTDLQV